MNIFTSYITPANREFQANLSRVLQANGHKPYPKHLKGFFGASGLHDPDELDEHLRDEELALVFISKEYMADRWLRGEIHALLTVERKLRPNFVLPLFLEGVEDIDIPEECLIKPHVDFRSKPFDDASAEVLRLIDEMADRPRLSVFLSHSSADADIAVALSDLLKAAFRLTSEEILATSVGGSRLNIFAHISETLRRKIREAKAFVCVATHNSFGDRERPGSFYVAVELGARWGMKRPLAMVLAAGAKGDLLRAPFSELNVLSCEDHSQVQQFIRQVAPVLGRDPETAETYHRMISRLVEVSKAAASKQQEAGEN
ncbi:MAG TPA: toll/interleukin-1 receptor domain-containing protein [Pyrinomonadaceae bacterium]|nr:toll/interleukin-1 receptor domain-containing protein [Pyrinomonadaceae bacterium]